MRCPACRFRHLEDPEARLHFITTVSGALAQGEAELKTRLLPTLRRCPRTGSRHPRPVMQRDRKSWLELSWRGKLCGWLPKPAPPTSPWLVRLRRWPCPSTLKWRPALPSALPPCLDVHIWLRRHVRIVWKSRWWSSPWLGDPRRPPPMCCVASAVRRGISLSSVATLASDSARAHWMAERRASELAKQARTALARRVVLAVVEKYHSIIMSNFTESCRL
jgi:hypothetical protein